MPWACGASASSPGVRAGQDPSRQVTAPTPSQFPQFLHGNPQPVPSEQEVAPAVVLAPASPAPCLAGEPGGGGLAPSCGCHIWLLPCSQNRLGQHLTVEFRSPRAVRVPAPAPHRRSQSTVWPRWDSCPQFPAAGSGQGVTGKGMLRLSHPFPGCFHQKRGGSCQQHALHPVLLPSPGFPDPRRGWSTAPVSAPRDSGSCPRQP